MILLLLSTLACKDGAVDDSATCGSTQGFITGVVYDVDGATPFPGASVMAWDDAGGAPIEALVDSEGRYELNLTGDQPWTLAATYRTDDTDCYTEDVLVELAACQELTLDFTFAECLIADKPNLYLYPERDQPTAVRLELDPRQRVVASDPAYRGAWRGLAHPDGTFSVGDARAPFLFYEVSLLPQHARAFQREAGWCLPAEGAVEAMAALLGDYGFNAREREDFIEAWQHDLPPAGAYAVWPQTEVDPMAGLHLQPALPVERLWLLVGDGAGCAPRLDPLVRPFDRQGPHAVEWGVVLEGLGR